MISVSAEPEDQSSGPVATVRPNAPHSAAPVNEPIMKTSPWAKLISSMIP